VRSFPGGVPAYRESSLRSTSADATLLVSSHSSLSSIYILLSTLSLLLSLSGALLYFVEVLDSLAKCPSSKNSIDVVSKLALTFADFLPHNLTPS